MSLFVGLMSLLNQNLSLCLTHAPLGFLTISRVSHHQKQNVSPADQIMLCFERHAIANIAFTIFRLKRLISVIVMFYKYAEVLYIYIYIQL